MSLPVSKPQILLQLHYLLVTDAFYIIQTIYYCVQILDALRLDVLKILVKKKKKGGLKSISQVENQTERNGVNSKYQI